MADTVPSLVTRLHDVMVALLSEGPSATATAELNDVIARAAPLGPDGAWVAAAGHATHGGLAWAHGRTDEAVHHFDAAVTAGYNDCVALHFSAYRPLHADPRFRALYERMRITEADFHELLWLHEEMHTMAQEARTASVDNIGRLDTGVSLLPQAPLPTREPDTAGVLVTRVELLATQTALRRAAVKADFQRSAGNTALGLIDDTWDYTRARHDAWHADDLDSRRERAAAARAFVERPGAGNVLLGCPPLGSVPHPG
ncbi:hypothetical protein ACFVU3_03640 [Streptomyces sp. NPDC058052]|uniref:hypothetical protein n=1 Tax=Streptomyces sp. NPDC058052 TaxID=3346316 RepID=UPI0036E3844F